MPKTFGKLGTRVRASRRMRKDAPSCFEMAAAPPPQHEGQRRRRHFGKPTGSASVHETNLRLWETIAGPGPLFPACYLQ